MYNNKRKHDLISATRISNYIRNDPIIDYLDIVAKNGYQISSSDLTLQKKTKTKTKAKSESEDNNPPKKSSFDYIVEDGYKFEESIIAKIKSLMSKSKNLHKLITMTKHEDINVYYNETKNIIESHKYDIILNAILINFLDNTYGYPDLIVTGSWIQQYITDPPKTEQHKYYIIDIKSSTIHLINNAQHVSTSTLYAGYKSQIFVYKTALDQIQHCNSNYGFILGKKYKFIQNHNEIEIHNPFSRLGIIDYSYEKSKRNDIKKKVHKAINWTTDLSKNWKTYKLTPPTRIELYPNMKNSYDKTHRKLKKRIATANHEITTLWNCGIAQRNLAFKKKIKTYLNPKLTPSILGLTPESSRYKILDKMLQLARSLNTTLISVSPHNNHNSWRIPTQREFYIDFETYFSNFDELSIDDDNTNSTEIKRNSCKLYMIGIGTIINNNYDYKCFIIDYPEAQLLYNNNKPQQQQNHNCTKQNIILVQSEYSLITEFIKYIYSLEPPSHIK